MHTNIHGIFCFVCHLKTIVVCRIVSTLDIKKKSVVQYACSFVLNVSMFFHTCISSNTHSGALVCLAKEN